MSFEGSSRIWFERGSPILTDFDNFKKKFGADNRILISFADEKGIFTPKALKTVERLTDELWSTNYVSRVDSIINYQYVHADKDNPDDILVDNFIDDIDSLSYEELSSKKDIAISDVQVENLLISADGKTTTVAATLIPLHDNDEHINLEIRRLVEDLVDRESKRSGYEFHLNGMPILTSEFVIMARHEMTVFSPVIALLGIIMLIAVFRNLSGAVLPFIVVLLTLLTVISIQVMTGYKINNFTANLPAFIMALGIADAMHIYWVWLYARKQGKDRFDAIRFSLEKNMLPAFLTSVTTFVGFISLASSTVIPVRTLGISTACAAIVAFLLSVGFLPAMLAVLRINVKVNMTPGTINKQSHAFAKKYSSFILNNDTKILASVLALSLCFVAGLIKVKIDNNSIKYFHEDTQIRKSVNFIEDRITGPMTFEIVLDSNSENGIKEPEFLLTVEKFYSDYRNEFKDLRHIGSLLDVIKTMNRVMHGEDRANYKVPDDKNLIAQYLLFYSFSLPRGMGISDKVDVTDRFLRLTASINMMYATEYMEMIEWIETWWKSTAYSAAVNGQNAMFTYMYKNVTDTIIYSITLAVTMVTLLMLISFRSFKVMIISMVPNILPLVLVVGLMGWLDIFIDIGVAVSGAVIIGVAVDDTIHFLVKYREARRSGKDLRGALEYMITVSGTAIIFTTIILSATFSVLMFSNFVPTSNFGIITVSALIVALVADLLLLPSLFSIVERYKVGKGKKEMA
jgi:predicted RND superfamily exporter protein